MVARWMIPLIMVGFVMAQAEETWTVFCHGPTEVMKNGQKYMTIEPQIWGANWKWTGLKSRIQGDSQKSQTHFQADIAGVKVMLALTSTQVSGNQLQQTWRLQAQRDVKITLAIVSIKLGKNLFAGQASTEVLDGSGQRRTVKMPYQRRGLGKGIRRVILTDAEGGRVSLNFNPPANISSDGDARIVLGQKELKANEPVELGMTLELPEAFRFYPSPATVPEEDGMAQWFEWRPTGDVTKPSLIGMEKWLDAPAGRYGRIRRSERQLLYNGKPIKLWGINLCYSACAPDKKLAERRAAMYAKYGINAVRLHKYADGPGWAGIQGEGGFTTFDHEKLDRMDYFIAKLKEKGIYVLLSPHFGTLKLGPEDLKYLPYWKEFGTLKGKGRNKRLKTPASSVYYSPELQQIHIQHTLNLLAHKNPYTGLRYADDPAIAFLEIINEQSVLFYTSMQPLKVSPTLRKLTAQRFCQWLEKRYGSEQGLIAAWGKRAFNSFAREGFAGSGESLKAQNILPLGNPWYWDPDNLDGSQKFRRRRLLDSMLFLRELQDRFYDRYLAAVRKAGFEGEVVASNWQAGRAYSHYSNLYSDARIGTIDRHNYFGGLGNSMCTVPGSGMLSSGMQQVFDRPFMLSEWIHVFPNEFGVEGPAILGAYGMGLQGWDASFIFQNRDNAQFSKRLGRDRWDVMAPQILSVFPAISRQVIGELVKESSLTAVRNVHVPSLAEGKLDFSDKVTQAYDVKTFDSDKVPARTLAVARCAVRFTQKAEPTPTFDLKPWYQDGALVSSTGELKWYEGDRPRTGCFTIDTPFIQAVVGFAAEKRFQLREMAITSHSRFAAIYIVPIKRNESLGKAQSLLLVTVARARNRGMKILKDTILVDKGNAPV
ncbi:MAG: hypothetical protein D6820_16740, partial [Lentisphaerae bacterium]